MRKLRSDCHGGQRRRRSRVHHSVLVGLQCLALAAAVAATVSCVRATPAVRAYANGVGLTPFLGWSSWSFFRNHPSAADDEAEAKALVTSGLSKLGYTYINQDDFWYECPGSQGPSVDRYGRWAIDFTKFPSSGSMNGIRVVADYVHSLGLKFGLYVTPGISKQAVIDNTPIKGTPYRADGIATMKPEKNYNCGGMVGIDYKKPGAQAFIDSWADELASWGVDYVKLDGVGSFDIPDIEAWSKALRKTGRAIHLELSNSLGIRHAAVWKEYSNGWRTTGDIECYTCDSGGGSYPLTDWANVASRFDAVAAWAPYGGKGGYNDYDAIEVGNGTDDGLTPAERRSQLSLWALGSSPLILGADLTQLDPTDLRLLSNRSVIAVDQDGIDASRIVNSGAEQVFAKTEKSGDVIVGLFNLTTGPRVIATSISALGLPRGSGYLLDDLWSHRTTASSGAISAEVPGHGVALYRVSREPTSK